MSDDGTTERYDRIGGTYTVTRRPDPRLAAAILPALGDAESVVNVGAGTGSYEPTDRAVIAVEPSSAMIAKRPSDAAPVVQGHAEALPLATNQVDAAMAVSTIHHWDPPAAGLAELRRVARGPVVIFTFELDALPAWQQQFLHEGLELERARFPAIAEIEAALGGRTRVERIPTPGDCLDGFFEAFWRRPEALLDDAVRGAQSIWALLTPAVEQLVVERLEAALDSGAWDAEHGHLRAQDSFDGALRLVISEAPASS